MVLKRFRIQRLSSIRKISSKQNKLQPKRNWQATLDGPSAEMFIKL